MAEMELRRKGYTLKLDGETGRVLGLFDTKTLSANWTAQGEGWSFGAPFLNGTQEKENLLPLTLHSVDENDVEFVSASGATTLRYELEEEDFTLRYRACPGCGPRMGVELDFNLLDLETGSGWRQQCMPTVIYTDPACTYAYLIFSTADKRFLAVGIDGDFAAWRIKYSYAGHRMQGFQVLNQADDVVTGDRPRLKTVNSLCIRFAFGDSIQSCLDKIAALLGVAIAAYPLSGGPCGAHIPLEILGKMDSVTVTDPEGLACTLQNGGVALRIPGVYEVKTVSRSGREHTSRLLCVQDWESIYDKVNHFYKDYFQHECGAFSRVIWKDTLSPNGGETFEGAPFGDPDKLLSCLTGEFGGYGAWAMIKNCQLFGEKPELLESVRRYLYHWALNRGHEDKPYPNTLYKKPAEFRGRKFGPYHLYREINYPQHEACLLQQFSDYYQLTGDKEILPELSALARHFMSEHMEGNGMIICQNDADGERVDYCTVMVPMDGLLRAADALKGEDEETSRLLYDAAERLADYVCRRGLDFPTEGEPCTEDGSMTCSAVTLLLAYRQLTPKPEYLETAKKILDAHSMLELYGTDCRMFGSSTRFWETQYESRDWGPSINAGHGWTIWMAEAKALMALCTADVGLLKEAYAGFLTNISRIDEKGGMPTCYTPDMIPGTPHGQAICHEDHFEYGDFPDLRPTTTYLGMQMVPKTYSMSGNYFLCRAADLWDKVSGYANAEGVCVNGAFKDGVFVSSAPQFDTLLVDSLPEGGLKVLCKAGQTIRLFVGEGCAPKAEGAQLLSQNGKEYTFEAKRETVLFS